MKNTSFVKVSQMNLLVLVCCLRINQLTAHILISGTQATDLSTLNSQIARGQTKSP